MDGLVMKSQDFVESAPCLNWIRFQAIEARLGHSYGIRNVGGFVEFGSDI